MSETNIVGKGDFILMDYIAKIKETNTIFDTTFVEEAKKAGIFKENNVYEPMLVVVGEGWVLKGLDEKLVGLEVGKKITVEIPPEKAFGPRDPSKIKSIPLRKFQQQKITPYPGLEVEVDGKLAVVRSVGAGRVQVDFNPPLAGRTLIYEVEVKQILQTPIEKIKALIHRRIPTVSPEKFEVEFLNKKVTIKMPKESLSFDRLQLVKRGIVSDIQKFFPDVEEVVFVDRYVMKKEVKAGEAEPKPEQAVSQSKDK
ncbi:peptidylprolyl isomerase [Candidatus Bathyarchaeota archaeon]|nr:MAG: peptidylprolyl isomerase [Candidatus Bathyarchaeota archaeon]